MTTTIEINAAFAKGQADFRTYHKSSITLVHAIKKFCTVPAYIDGMAHEAEMTSPVQVSQIRKVAEMYAANKGGNKVLSFTQALSRAYEVMEKKSGGAKAKSKKQRAATFLKRGIKQFGYAAMAAAMEELAQ